MIRHLPLCSRLRKSIAASVSLYRPVTAIPDKIAISCLLLQLLVGDALVAEVAFHAGLGYLLIRLAGGGEKRLEALQPDIVRLRELQAANRAVQGLLVTTTPGALSCSCPIIGLYIASRQRCSVWLDSPADSLAAATEAMIRGMIRAS